MTDTSHPIRHIVLWRVAAETEPDRRAAIDRVRSEFESLRGRIPGLLRLEIGVDVSRVAYACDMVLVSDFDSPDALAAYAGHPEHLAVRQRLEGLRIARHQVDYPIGGSHA